MVNTVCRMRLFFLLTCILWISNFVVPQPEHIIIDAVCRRTTFPEFCKTLMLANCQSADADIIDVGHTAINIAKRHATADVQNIKERIITTSDSNIKNALRECKAAFKTVQSDMSEVKALWDNWNLVDAKSIATRNIGSLRQACNVGIWNMIDVHLKDDIESLRNSLIRKLHIIEAACDVALLPVTDPFVDD